MAAPSIYPLRQSLTHSRSTPAMPPQPQQRSADQSRSSAGNGPQKPGKQLVFMNFTDPAVDAKKTENRKLIARFAMLNRPRPTEQPTTSPPSVQSTSPPLAPPAAGQARGISFIRNDSSYSSTSPPETTTTWSTTTGSPPNPDLSDWETTSQQYQDYFNINFGGLDELDLDGDDFASLLSDDMMTSYTGTQFDVAAANPSQSAAVGASSHPREERPRKKPVRKPNSRITQPSNALTVQHKGRRQPQPTLEILGAPVDPFECLPMKADAHTHELIYSYLNARLVSEVFAKPGSLVLNRLKQSRDAMWWPLTRGSKAALAALIAYVEATPGLKNKARSPAFMQKHLDTAMAAVSEALQNGTATDDSICFAIVLLMITAQRLRDNDIFKVHVNMLTQILAQRAHGFEQNPSLEGVSQKRGISLPAPDNGIPSQRCLYCRDVKNAVPLSTESSPEEAVEESQRPDVEFRGSGFTDLIHRKVLSESMRYFIDQALAWNKIAVLARLDRLSAASAASHAWVDGSPHQEARTPFDMAVMYATRLCLYLSAWLDWQHSCSAVRSMLGAVHEGLKHSNIELLLEQSPDALLWMSLLAGPYSEGEARLFFSDLLVKARVATSTHDFDIALANISDRYLWTPTMTPGSQKFFWDGLGLGPMYMPYPPPMAYMVMQPWQSMSGLLGDGDIYGPVPFGQGFWW